MPVTIRPFLDHQDYLACVDLQRATWGADFRECVPPAMLLIAQKVGGIAAGAFSEDGTLAGFVYGITGLRDGSPCHWSHMLAVRDDYRDRGLGRRLKEYQRAELLQRGVTLMFWTYDPLVARNAHLNLQRLGTRVTEYVADLYGENGDSVMDSVIGTDRFIVAWDLDRPVTRPSPEVDPNTAGVNVDGDRPRTDQPAYPEDARVAVRIPSDIHALKNVDPDRARAWRTSTRHAFQHYLGRGYDVVGFAASADYGSYLMERRPA